MIKNIKLIIVTTICLLLITIYANTAENKILLKINNQINLELPLKYGQKISGHICQGHVDTVGKIFDIKKIDKSYLFDFEISKNERKNLIAKGITR